MQSVRVNGHRATWRRHAGELTIDPKGVGLRRGQGFRTVIRYGGRPRLFQSQSLGAGGFFHTDDGAVVAGQPHAASAWFPVNDHPTDKAAYTFRITAPRSLQVVANGVAGATPPPRRGHEWTWAAGKPMASYLATIAIGHFDLRTTEARHQLWDAIDAGCSDRSPRPGPAGSMALASRPTPPTSG